MRIDLPPTADGHAAPEDRDAPAPELSPQAPGAVLQTPSSSNYKNLLESVYDAVLLTDGEGCVVDCNVRARDFFLCARSELVGASILELIAGSGASLIQAIERNLQQHRYTLIEAHCRRRDRSLFPAEVAVNRLFLSGRKGLCFFVRDISVRKRAQAELEDVVSRLKAHDRARSEFVSNVSHELRTPLTSMIYAVNNMLRGAVGPLQPKVREYLEMLSGDCKRLLGTVNDILDLRKVESRTLALNRSRMPFGLVVRNVVESLRAHAGQKHVRMVAEYGGGNWFVDGDSQKLERVVWNILGNAIKFTPEKGEIRVRVFALDDPSGKVQMTVRDSGIGIPADSIGRVTQRYFTVGDPPSGSGLGLAIAEEIVALHGGKLELQSPPPDAKAGTEVRVVLPLVDPPTILIVDDEEDVRRALRVQVESEGYRTLEAASGDEALQRTIAQRPDLILLDVFLPGMQGTELILKLKADSSTKRIPVLVLSGKDVGPAAREILKRFAIPLLRKPWSPAELLDRVSQPFAGGAGRETPTLVGV